MRRLVVHVTVSALLGLLPGSAAARWVAIGDGPAQPVVTGTSARLEVTWSMPGFDLVATSLDGADASRVGLPGRPLLQESGWPEVPCVPVRLDVPARGRVRLEILEHRVREIPVAPVLPSLGHRPHLPGQDDPSPAPGPFYAGKAVWPVTPAVLGRPFLVGDDRGAILRLQPLRYDAGRGVLLVTEYVRVAVVTGGETGANETDATKASSAAAPRMLVVAPDALQPALAELVGWKTRCGIDVETVSPAQLGGTAAAIANGIRARYAAPAGLEWVLLVGDRAQVPALAGTYEGALSDQRYAMVAGDDLRPDLMVSRLPARTAAEAATQVARILAYERDVTAGAGTFDRASGVASAEGSPADHDRADALRTDLLAGGFASVDRVYELYGAGTGDVRNAVRGGASLVNYLGHGSGTAWQSVPFTTADVRALGNTSSWPWIVDASCLNGDFARDECLAEAWLRAGSAAAPAGAVGVLAATSLVPWTPPIHMQGGIVDALTAGTARSLGELTRAGLDRVLDIYDGLPVAAQVIEQYVLFGDASLQVRTRTPLNCAVTVDRDVGARDAVWWVEVDGPPGAVVALSSGSVLCGRGTVGADGWAEVTLYDLPPAAAQLDLTVTGPDLAPWLGKVDVVDGVSEVTTAEPGGLRDLGNHPNPFNPATVIACELDAAAPVHLTVHDLAGRRVRVLAAGQWREAGRQEFTWDGRDGRGRRLGSGVYFYRLRTPWGVVGGRMTLVK